MIDLYNIEEVSKKEWLSTLQELSPDSEEEVTILHENEEAILDELFEYQENKPIEEKRKDYVRWILEEHYFKEDIDDIVQRICDIRSENNYSIVQLGKKLPGSSYVVLEFGDKILKFGKKCRILNVPSLILQPEETMPFGTNNEYIYVYERLPFIFPRNDFVTAQNMYNRARDKGVLWFDAIGNNVGKTNNRIDENDDGLRIIDAQYMEYESEVLRRIDPPNNPKYAYAGPSMYKQAIRDYIYSKYYKHMEDCYQQMCIERRMKASKQDVEKTTEDNSVKGLRWVLKKLVDLIYGKDYFGDGIGK